MFNFAERKKKKKSPTRSSLLVATSHSPLSPHRRGGALGFSPHRPPPLPSPLHRPVLAAGPSPSPSTTPASRISVGVAAYSRGAPEDAPPAGSRRRHSPEFLLGKGDTLQRWRTEPYIMITGSGRWVPPPLSSHRSPEREKESTFAAGRSRRVEVERTLTDSQRDESEDMLRALTLERSQIKEAMGFALDNADAAGEIVEVLTESLTLKETPIPTKAARLMLVSDILHSSSAPVKNASAFRTKFEASLPDVTESSNDLYRSITGRIIAEALKERVMKVLQVWADWSLFSEAYLNGLRTTFLRSSNSSVILFHSLCGDAPEIEKEASSEDGNDGFKLNEDGVLATGKAEQRRSY